MEQNQKRDLKLTAIYLSLSFIILGLIFKFGLAGAVKISELLQRGKPTPAENPYGEILPVPQFYPLPDATNSASLWVSGYSQPNQQVDIYLNDLNVKTFDTDSEGKFGDFLSLSLGTSKIYSVAKDSHNRQSLASNSWSVFYSNTPPFIEVIEPENGALIKRSPNPVEIKGKVNSTSKVEINDHLVQTQADPNSSYSFFDYAVKLNSGENKIKIVCRDPAENKTLLEWTLHFQP